MRVFLSLALVVAGGSAQPQRAARPAAASRSAQVDQIFAGFNTHTPGCAVGVAKNGEVELTAGYGMADLERNVPIAPGTVFESGSLAKQFTAGALMLLAQQGKLSLDDPLRKHLPELHPSAPPITIRQVISHVSGIREWRPLATFGGMPEGTYVFRNEDILKMAARQRGMNFDPGTNYSYSNTGYNVAPILIDRVLAGTATFQRFTHESIFAPLGMKQTRWRDDFRTIVPQRALAYGRSGSGWKQQTPIENIFGAGGLLTTVTDLLLWNENFTHAKVGGVEFVKAQQTPFVLTSGKQIAYGAGLQVGTYDGLREVSHGGATGGYRTWLARYPEQGVSVAVMCNSASANPAALGRETARLWTGTRPAPAAVTSHQPEPAQLAALVGSFRSVRDNGVEEVVLRNGKLLWNGAELSPTGEGRFALGASSGATLTFEPGAARFRLATANDDILFERVEPVKSLARTELAAFVGDYESAEAGGVVRVEWDTQGTGLLLRPPSGVAMPLQPSFRDTFQAGTSGAAVHFRRDGTAAVTGLSIGEGRVWDLRFARVARP